MKEILYRESKKNLIAECMHNEFEKKITDILRSKIRIPELDKKIDPLVRQFFKELSAIFDYYSETGEPTPYVEDENFIRIQKHGVLCHCMREIFTNDVELFLRNTKSLQAIDGKLDNMLDSYFGFIEALDAFYGIESEDDDEE